MQSYKQTQPDPLLTQQVPWWNDLDPAVPGELELSDIRSLPAQTVDVVVIGGGVAGLSAALSASRAGAHVLVLESAAMLGLGALGVLPGIVLGQRAGKAIAQTLS
jgi:NADPH-dependent 2,4-dienoyl-CoA reductase/sulfur reductase-like enzyme